MSVSVRNRQRRLSVSPSRLGAVARSALLSLQRTDRDLHVTVVGDREIQRLHERYLGVRSPTDVLAFNLELSAGTRASPRPRSVGVSRPAAPLALRESRSLDGPSRLLGEVIMSADTAARQAARLGIALALEMDLLLVHGLLHLVGYDDRDPGAARLMHEREYQILSRARRRPPPARLFTGLIEQGVGTRASPRPRPAGSPPRCPSRPRRESPRSGAGTGAVATRAPRWNIAQRSSRSPARAAVDLNHRR